jgi:ribosomal protein S18 acetylase RimI-like enzyme
MIQIRAARLEDAGVLWAAEVETSRTPGRLVGRPHEFKVEAFAEKIADLKSRGRYVVAERDGLPVGHALLEPMGLERVAHVHRLTIVVHPGCLGMGVGTALMKDLMEWSAATPAVGKVELHVRATNEVAVRLYRKFGFVEEGRMKNRIKLEDGSYIDDISMGWFPNRQ